MHQIILLFSKTNHFSKLFFRFAVFVLDVRYHCIDIIDRGFQLVLADFFGSDKPRLLIIATHTFFPRYIPSPV